MGGYGTLPHANAIYSCEPPEIGWSAYDVQVLIARCSCPFCDDQKTLVWTRP